MNWLREITTYDNATILDIESDGLLDEATKFHVVGFKMHGIGIKCFHGERDFDKIVSLFEFHIDKKIPIVMHNGITFDSPLVEKLTGMDLNGLQIIDTFALSHYLNVDRKRHGLDHFFEEYGIEKPPIDDWHNLSYDDYKHRVIEDVKITECLWNDLRERLVEMYSLAQPLIDSGKVDSRRVSDDEVLSLDSIKGIGHEKNICRLLSFLMSKEQVRYIQERTGWHVDEEYLASEINKMECIVEESAKALESVMPKVPKYASRRKPAKPYKKDGTLSASGSNWERLKGILKTGEKDELGNPIARVRKVEEIEELVDYTQPNINSHQQVKDFLYSKGWKPTTFKYVRDDKAFEEWLNSRPLKSAPRGEWTLWKDSRPEDRAIEQVKSEGELCESVVELAEKVPEISVLEEYSVVTHRLSVLKGIQRSVVDGKTVATWMGTTNTLRCKHSGSCVNLPSTGRKYAEGIRGCLVAPDGYISLGSDLSSLENRVGHHFMLAYDKAYVETMMSEDYDPHLATAVAAGLITEEESNEYKKGNKTPRVSDARQQGKTANYALVYGGGVGALVKGGIPEDVAKRVFEAYWGLNWSVKAIAEHQTIIKDSKGLRWLVNPINGFLYNVRSDKDIFNTLVQGSGSYCFDMWVFTIHNKMIERWGSSTQTGAFHDEIILVIRDTPKTRELFEEMVVGGIKEVSDSLNMRIELGCDVQFGKRYSEIH